MNIAIIGATGMVGARTAAEAVSRGHQVDAYTRSGKAPEGTTAHTIDLADTATLVDIVNNHDVTIVAVSAGRGTSAQPVIDAHRAPSTDRCGTCRSPAGRWRRWLPRGRQRQPLR